MEALGIGQLGERVREGLETLIAACPGHGRAADCPILRALTDE
jgi:MerR family transcriptional regulator, copper efflux regulator